MKVSILMPAFRSLPFIKMALQSVATQTHEDWELIVVENGSCDGTEAVVDAFASSNKHHIIYQRFGTNSSPGSLKNRLIEFATGQALAFLIPEDHWEREHLSTAIELIRNGGDLAVSGVRQFDLVTKRLEPSIQIPATLKSDPVCTLFQHNVIPTTSAVVMTKKLTDRTGQFDPTLRLGDDQDYWLRCALEGSRFATTASITCNHAMQGDTLSNREITVAEQKLRFYHKYRSLAEVPPKLRRRLLAASLVRLGRVLRQRDPARSAACFWRAWQCEPFNPRIPFHLALQGWRSAPTENAA